MTTDKAAAFHGPRLEQKHFVGVTFIPHPRREPGARLIIPHGYLYPGKGQHNGVSLKFLSMATEYLSDTGLTKY